MPASLGRPHVRVPLRNLAPGAREPPHQAPRVETDHQQPAGVCGQPQTWRRGPPEDKISGHPQPGKHHPQAWSFAGSGHRTTGAHRIGPPSLPMPCRAECSAKQLKIRYPVDPDASVSSRGPIAPALDELRHSGQRLGSLLLLAESRCRASRIRGADAERLHPGFRHSRGQLWRPRARPCCRSCPRLHLRIRPSDQQCLGASTSFSCGRGLRACLAAELVVFGAA